jgi:hypothetical protein
MAQDSLMQSAGKEAAADTEQDDAGLGIGHLQLGPQLTGTLLGAKLETIADVLIFATSDALANYEFRDELVNALGRLRKCTTGNSVNWRKYWVASGMRFHHLSATLPELDRLSPSSEGLPLSVELFGKAALPLSRAGFRTLGLLREGLRAGIPHVPGLGPGRRSEFFDRLISLADGVDATGDVRQPAWASPALSVTGPLVWSAESGGARTAQPLDPLGNLGPGVRELPVGFLHIGHKAMWFRHAGMTTIGQISAAWPIRVGQIPNIGASTIDLIGERFAAILASVSDGENLDPVRYTGLIGAALLPEEADFATGDVFLASLPSVVSQIASRLKDPLDAAILLRRIAKPPGEQETLDDLAKSHRPRVSRERVRQKERGLLKELARGLIWDDYGELGIHFRSSFSARWKAAADRFRGSDEITFAGFMAGLCEVWGVDAGAVIQQAPVIMAVVTGDAQMPASFRSGFRIDPCYYGPLPASTTSLKLRVLRLGKHADGLLEYGIETVGDLIDCCRTGRIAEIESKASREGLAQLGILAGCLTEDGAVDWSRYRQRQKIPVVPAVAPASAADFMRAIATEVETLLRESGITGRAADIFRLRTSRQLVERLTLDETAQRLGTYGPSVKREETVFLEFLNDLVVGRDFAQAPAWLDETWLGYWREANELYLTAPADFERFARMLIDKWGLPQSARSASLPTLWAVLSGYPDGRRQARRRGRLTANPAPAETAADTGRIRLTGFARLH